MKNKLPEKHQTEDKVSRQALSHVEKRSTLSGLVLKPYLFIFVDKLLHNWPGSTLDRNNCA
jgi:hypothetical protein